MDNLKVESITSIGEDQTVRLLGYGIVGLGDNLGESSDVIHEVGLEQIRWSTVTLVYIPYPPASLSETRETF